MMQKYGVENATQHFMSFNTICDATQVSDFAFSLVKKRERHSGEGQLALLDI